MTGRALGRRPPKNAPALMLGPVLTGVLPEIPVAADHFAGATFGLYENDSFGVCGPVSAANLLRLVSFALLVAEVIPSQDDVFDLYRRSGNPDFNPITGAGDDGVDMQTMLEALLEGGIGDGQGGRIYPVAFAKLAVLNDAELDAAVAIFGGSLWGVTLEVAQQEQTDAVPPRWDYVRSSAWGGHAVLNGKFDAAGDDEVISWEIDVQTTPSFRAQQLEEAWVVVWPWNLEHPAFLEGVDVAALASAFEALTGRTLPVPIPAPLPPPDPGPDPLELDRLLYSDLSAWAHARHVSTNRAAARAVLAWAKARGFE